MKSYCVLNSAVTPAVCEKIGTAVAKVLGGKLAVLYSGSDVSFATAQNIAKGIKKQGGCALLANDAFEAQNAFACEHFSLNGALFVNGNEKSSISVCGDNARNLTAAEEDEISDLVSNSKMNWHRGGAILGTELNSIYYKYLLESAQSLEGIAVIIKTDNLIIKNHIARVLLALGGENKGKVTFCLSSSGVCMSAVDEYGVIHTRDELLSVMYALKIIRDKTTVEIPFSLSEGLEMIAKEKGVEIKRSFAGGNELFTRDSVFLSLMLMKYMSQNGCGLCELCEIVPRAEVCRKNLLSSVNILEFADRMECEQLVTDGDNVFAKLKDGNVILTPNGTHGRYCLEVRAADSETAREIALNLTELNY